MVRDVMGPPPAVGPGRLTVEEFLSDVVLAWCFYELLAPVDGGLARLGAFLRVADAAILAGVTLNGLIGTATV